MPKPLYQRVLFRLHWIAGITAGLVLAVVGVTGGLLGFEQPILGMLNPAWHVAAARREILPPQRWIDVARAAHPELVARSVDWNGNDQAATVRMAADKGRGIEVGIDPYTASVLGAERGSGFFHTTEQLHRTLATGPIGKQVVGASTALLIAMIATGIYLRWPRRARSPAAWLTFSAKLKGRGFWWHLHAVAGTWLLLFYLAAALTGLWWSYDFYRDAVNRMAGVEGSLRKPQPRLEKDAPTLPIDLAWQTFHHAVPTATRAMLALSSASGKPLEIRYQTPDSAHDRAWDILKVDATSGAVVANEKFADQPRGRRFIAALFPLHSGGFFGWAGKILMALASLLMPLFTASGIWLWVLRRRNESRRLNTANRLPDSQRSSAPRAVETGAAR